MPPTATITTEQIDKAARILSEKRPAYAALLAFYADVFTAQETAKGTIDLEPLQLTADAVERCRQAGTPLVAPADFRIDPAAGESLLAEICTLVTTHKTAIQDAASTVAAALEDRRLNMPALYSRLIAGDEDHLASEAARIEVEPQALAFLSHLSLQPSVDQCAVQLSTYLDSAVVAHRGLCPLCGRAPGMAVLETEGRRWLVCSFCRHQWRVPRIFCTACENTQAAELHYLFAEAEKDLRVDVCERCRRYLKTVDSREVDRPLFIPLEQVASLHLDMVAAEKGYQGRDDLNLGF
jgi:FdhE protein